ncbi:MAG: NADH-quinone oxidoreductase subunit NuoE [Alphaproteobacteria bacterium]
MTAHSDATATESGGVTQPESFSFTPENRKRAAAFIARYPEGRQASAVLPLLDLAQRQHGGWLPRAAMDHVAELLGMAKIRVYEVGTFYSMLNLAPVGQHHVQVCTTTPCWLRGSDGVLGTCQKVLGIQVGQTTEDGRVTLSEVECQGACVNAPMLRVNDSYFEDLDPERTEALLNSLLQGRPLRPGPQSGRKASEPAAGLTTLTEPAPGKGGGAP